MKILNIMLGSKKGGLEQVFVDYINAELSQNHDVSAICMQNCPYLDEVSTTDAKVHTLKSRSAINPFTALKIRKIIKTENPDIIVLCGNRPVKLTVSHYINNIFKINTPVLSIINNNHCYTKDIKYAAAVSKDIQQKTINEGIKNTFLIPNTTKKVEKQINKMPSIPTIGAIGRLHKNKDFETFLYAIKKLTNTTENFNVIIAGDGPEKNNLLELTNKLNLQDKVKFIGWTNKKEDFYNNIDIFCLSSKVEPFGIVLLEAMAYCKPIVTTNCQGPIDIFENAESAIIVNKQNAEELSLGLKKLLLEKDLGPKLAQNAYERFCNEYSNEKLSERLNNAFNFILKQENNK